MVQAYLLPLPQTIVLLVESLPLRDIVPGVETREIVPRYRLDKRHRPRSETLQEFPERTYHALLMSVDRMVFDFRSSKGGFEAVMCWEVNGRRCSSEALGG